MGREIKSGMLFRHFKGNLYEVICIAKHTETWEDCVVYKSIDGNQKIYVRPFEMFNGLVDKEKYPEVKQEYRFEVVK